MKPPIYQAAVRWFYLKLWYAGLFASTEPFEMLFGLHACSFRISVFKCIYYFLMCFVTTSHCCSVKCGHEIHGNIVQTVYDAAVEIISCCIGYLCMKFNVAAYISVKVITRTAVCHFANQLAQVGDFLRCDCECSNCGYAGFQITASLSRPKSVISCALSLC